MTIPTSINRRNFLRTSSLIALAPSIPLFLRSSLAGTEANLKGRILVVVQLSGGNDGINTVVPYADEGYAKNRKELRIPTDKLVRINDQIGLHPSLRSLGQLFEERRLAIAQGVGYPNPNRSHDVSMAIWQTARMDPTEHDSFGWIGRALDQSVANVVSPPRSMLVGDQSPPVAIRGRKSAFAVTDRLTDLQLKSKRSLDPKQTAPSTSGKDDQAAGSLADFVRRTTLDAYATSDVLAEVAAKAQAGTTRYPSNELGRRLEMIGQLIKADIGTSVYYVSQSGYDTHAVQLPTHERLLGDLSNGLKAFLDDLKAAKLDDRVVVLSFSEFGRPLIENASLGTDHGTVGPVFIAGANVKSGLYGTTPSLTDLDNGDLKMSLDFRQVYATLLNRWLNVSTEPVLGGSFEPIAFL
jgi:uncharacterized protein (DUF1501 family)